MRIIVPIPFNLAAKAGYELETEWSTCTVAKYSAVYSELACLKQGDESECGNGIVEEGEKAIAGITIVPTHYMEMKTRVVTRNVQA